MCVLSTTNLTGVIPIAHNSGGPARDIVPVPGGRAGSGADAQRCGYLCTTVEEYVEALTRVLLMPQTERLKMAAEGRRCADGAVRETRGVACMQSSVTSTGMWLSFRMPIFGSGLRRRCGRCCSAAREAHEGSEHVTCV